MFIVIISEELCDLTKFFAPGLKVILVSSTISDFRMNRIRKISGVSPTLLKPRTNLDNILYCFEHDIIDQEKRVYSCIQCAKKLYSIGVCDSFLFLNDFIDPVMMTHNLITIKVGIKPFIFKCGSILIPDEQIESINYLDVMTSHNYAFDYLSGWTGKSNYICDGMTPLSVCISALTNISTMTINGDREKSMIELEELINLANSNESIARFISREISRIKALYCFINFGAHYHHASKSNSLMDKYISVNTPLPHIFIINDHNRKDLRLQIKRKIMSVGVPKSGFSIIDTENDDSDVFKYLSHGLQNFEKDGFSKITAIVRALRSPVDGQRIIMFSDVIIRSNFCEYLLSILIALDKSTFRNVALGMNSSIYSSDLGERCAKDYGYPNIYAMDLPNTKCSGFLLDNDYCFRLVKKLEIPYRLMEHKFTPMCEDVTNSFILEDIGCVFPPLLLKNDDTNIAIASYLSKKYK